MYSDTGMICNLSCTFKEYNLSQSKDICKSTNCTHIRVVMSDSQYACILSPAEIAQYPITKQYIWNSTETNIYRKLNECDYTGSISASICYNNGSLPVCECTLKPVYSYTGMICNASCTYPEFNLSLNGL